MHSCHTTFHPLLYVTKAMYFHHKCPFVHQETHYAKKCGGVAVGATSHIRIFFRVHLSPPTCLTPLNNDLCSIFIC